MPKPPRVIPDGALLLLQDGRYWERDGTTWTGPYEGLSIGTGRWRWDYVNDRAVLSYDPPENDGQGASDG